MADTGDAWHDQNIYEIVRDAKGEAEDRRQVLERKTTKRKVQKRTRLLSRGLLTNGPLKKAHRDITRDRKRLGRH